MDLGQILAFAEKGGASQDELDSIAGQLAEVKYEAPTKVIVPEFYLESDKVIFIGKDEHKLRELNTDDWYSVAPSIIQYIYQFMASGELQGESAEKILEDSSPDDVFKLLIAKVIEAQTARRKGGKHHYPEWLANFFEDVAFLVTTEQREVTPGTIVAMPLRQQIEMYYKLYEIGKQDFLFIWAQMPEGMRLWISTLVSNVTTAAQNIGKMMKDRKSSLDGGISDTSKTSSSSRSKKSKGSRKAK